MKKQTAGLIFLLIVVGIIAGEVMEMKLLEYLLKPLVMVWISVYFIIYGEYVEKNARNFALAAFFFSWLGDVVLMFSGKGFFFFLSGILFFLGAQLFYLFTFLKLISLTQKIPFLRKKVYWLIPFFVYGLIFYILLYNHLSVVLRFCILVYMTALLSMSLMALNRKNTVSRQSFLLVFGGSLMFVLSDSLLAVNVFLRSLPYEGIWVMSTYIAAQYLIVNGILSQFEGSPANEKSGSVTG